MIIVRLLGGLGNQLFQYAAGLSLAHFHGQRLILDCTRMDNYSLRDYGLNNFCISAPKAKQEQIFKFTHSNKPKIIRELYKGWHRLKPYYRRPIYKEPYFHYDPKIWQTSKNVYLSGYFVSEKYFAHIQEAIQSEFRLSTIPSSANKTMLNKIKNSTAISLHIRRGDYAHNHKTLAKFGLCSLEYYQRCMQVIEAKISKPHYFVFSDDIFWAKNNLKAKQSMTFVDINDGQTAYEDLRLMSLCEHHIIANSTFSWWGAWLGTNPHKLVLVPKNWFKQKNINTKDLYPQNWLTV
jgi:hypothetical protein